MKRLSHRIKDDPKIWKKLPAKPDAALEYLFEKLIEESETIGALVEKKGCSPFDEDVRKKVSSGQEMLLLMFRLDTQILNGGVTQFIWNSPLEMEDAGKTIKKLKQTELAKAYKKVEARVMEKLDEFANLRNKWAESLEPDWAVFQESYKILQVDWFDELYMKKHRTDLVQAMIDYVLKHKDEFVK